MKSLAEIKQVLQSHKKMLSAKYGLTNIAIFGSASRGESTELSDIDLLVEFEKPIGLDFVLLGDELEEILGVKVDIVTPSAIKPKMLENIKRDLEYV